MEPSALTIERFAEHFSKVTAEDFAAKRQAVDLAFLRQGITFNVYGDAQGAERIFPFDLMPRIIPGQGMGATRARPRSSASRR